jgi:hypothetical protein
VNTVPDPLNTLESPQDASESDRPEPSCSLRAGADIQTRGHGRPEGGRRRSGMGQFVPVGQELSFRIGARKVSLPGGVMPQKAELNS